jgi:hypothetical protein
MPFFESAGMRFRVRDVSDKPDRPVDEIASGDNG